MYLVNDLYQSHGPRLGLEILAGLSGINRFIKAPEAERPGLSLAGYLKNHKNHRILVIGKVELEYLKELTSEIRIARLDSLLHPEKTPAVIVTRNHKPPKELILLCNEKKIPLFITSLSATEALCQLIILLQDEFALTTTLSGTLVEVFGLGILLKGDSTIGKSETALSLIERGHRLIADDLVKVKKKEDSSLVGSGDSFSKHHLEIRGIGIVNVANLYGVVAIKDYKNIDIVVQLEHWNEMDFYDRVGLEEKSYSILDILLPFHLLPVKPDRNIALLIETIALNHRLKNVGFNTTKEFQHQLKNTIARTVREEALCYW